MIRVLIAPPILEKIRHWTAMAPGEFSALGLVEKDAEDLRVTEIFLPRQSCTAMNTEMESEDVARLLLDLENRGVESRKLCLWLHSHGEMKTFWSGTDDATIEGLANDGYVVSIVVNKAGDVLCRVDLFEPFRHTFHKVPVEPLLPDYGLHEVCKAEMAEKVRHGHDLALRAARRSREFLDLGWGDASPLELEQRLRDGEITHQEFLAGLDALEGFV